mmetsp:Transcript_97795/g.272180  ORF Transcript_97795/g.272180 Transcript_97795/m.272180 type:complete len:207 (+) Transcript_97795:964-1584(+)
MMYTSASRASLHSPESRSRGQPRLQARAVTARHTWGTALPSSASRCATELAPGPEPGPPLPSAAAPGQARWPRCCNSTRRQKSTSKHNARAANATLFGSLSTRRTSRKTAQHWQRKRTSRDGYGKPCVSSSRPKTKPCTCCKREDEMCNIVRCVGDRLGPKKAWVASSVAEASRHTSLMADCIDLVLRFRLGFASTMQVTGTGPLA